MPVPARSTGVSSPRPGWASREPAPAVDGTTSGKGWTTTYRGGRVTKNLMPEAERSTESSESSAPPEPGRCSLTMASRTPRAHGRRTIAKLLDAAVSEFASYDYHGASMARIAKRAGTAHVPVYLHFADKDDLLSAAMTDVSRDLEPALGAVRPFEPGEEGLAALNEWLKVA